MNAPEKKVVSLPTTNTLGTLPHIVEQYCTKRCMSVEDLRLLKVELLTGAEAAHRLGLGRAKTEKFSSWPWALYLPGWKSDGSINEKYGHAIFFNEHGGRVRLATSGHIHPNDAIFMPIGQAYSDLGPNSTIYICESFFKAALLWRKFGVPAVALSGVDGWSRGNGRLCAGLCEDWWGVKYMRAVILFDSLSTDKSSRSKVNVMRARKSVLSRMVEAQAIKKRKVSTNYIELPPPPEELNLSDWGLDDYSFHHGVEKLREVIDVTNFLDDNSESTDTAIDEFSSRYVWIKALDKAYDMQSRCLYSKQNLFNNEENNKAYIFMEGKPKIMSVAKSWMGSPSRRSVQGVSFLPGEDDIIDDNLNLWTGFAVQPSTDPDAKARAHKYWIKVIHEAFPDGGEHLIRLLAYRVQNPHRRLMTYLYVYGKFGTAKNYIFNVMQEIAGIGQFPALTYNNYIQQFNGSKLTAWGMLINEMPEFMDKKEAASMEVELRLDSDPAQKHRPVEPKNKEIIQTNRNSLVICIGNFDPCWPIMYGDRRTFALHSSDGMAVHKPDRPWGRKTQAWWDERWAWMRQTGPEDVLAYLLSLDVSDFNPEGEPPETEYKKELAANGKRGFAGWLGELHANPKAIEARLKLPEGAITYVTTDQIMEMFKKDTKSQLDNSASAGRKIGKELSQVAVKVQKWIAITQKNDTLNVWHIRGEKLEDSTAIHGKVSELGLLLLGVV